MAKRFTDTNKYKKPFLRGLQGAYKLLWDFLYHECDHAGIWIVDFEIAQIYLGSDMKVNKQDALLYFNYGENRIIEVDNGNKWFIPSFIEFQYGKLNPENRAHNSVICVLNKYNLYDSNKGLITPLQGCKDMDKDKDKDMDMENGEKLKTTKQPKKKKELVEAKIPDFDNFKTYAFLKEPTLNLNALKNKYDSWVENGWRDGNDNSITNWKTKILNTIPFILKDKISPQSENKPTIKILNGK